MDVAAITKVQGEKCECGVVIESIQMEQDRVQRKNSQKLLNDCGHGVGDRKMPSRCKISI